MLVIDLKFSRRLLCNRGGETEFLRRVGICYRNIIDISFWIFVLGFVVIFWFF